VEIGSQITRLKVVTRCSLDCLNAIGVRDIIMFFREILQGECLGAWSEFAKTREDFIALKPAGWSMAHAASVPLAAMTALQALQRYKGSLEGKTVLVPAGCTFMKITSFV
jgi:NADPH:quinone reductase-like Zn-dependent oxidoreductase